MKATSPNTGTLMVLALSAGLILGQGALAAAEDTEHDDHAAHDHAAQEGKAHEDHAGQHDDGEHDHGDHGHVHEKRGGPNGGRMILDVEPHLEFLVKPNRHVELRAFDHDRNAVAFGEQWVQLIGGSRRKPTRLRFALDNDVLESDMPLPQGDSVPVVLRVRKAPASAVITIKFNVNLSDCEGCDFKEYACNCEH